VVVYFLIIAFKVFRTAGRGFNSPQSISYLEKTAALDRTHYRSL
jgi:hypothetical protein